ncbi:isochorismatase family protein [Poseidonocella sedimentorum]|uniref:Bifunctional isochorismate lyase / aryl carrier protein n=1 Tax=Poseidonocella sedimentorum TaxID=871652 RepID=A0A1I6E422_9RHOB|nr:isochorismatase family protein [Poseidonocella sedimentorum]SFR12446.1 bifunctional isochorismate lyase / aryl carrier protein [Poseidonocella sedimentorum]
MALPRIPDYPLPAADALPASRATFALEPARAALLIHDMQRYFCAAYGAEAWAQDGALLQRIVSNIARLAVAARAAGMPVFYTAQKGDQFLPDRGLQANLWGPGMRAVPEHEEIIPPLAPQPGDIRLVKHRYSAFQRSNLETLMRARGRDQLIVTGIYAHIGCLATVGEAFQRDIEPFFAADALGDFSQDKHQMALDWVASCAGVVLSGDAACARIGGAQ